MMNKKSISILTAAALLLAAGAVFADGSNNIGFLRAVPAEVETANFSGSLLGAILQVVAWVVMIMGAAGMVGVGFKTVDSAMKTLTSIDYGQATYGKLVANIVAGIAVELIFVGMMTFSWQYIKSATDAVKKKTTQTGYILNNHPATNDFISNHGIIIRIA